VERRRSTALYLGAALAVRLCTEGVGVALVLVAATQLHSVALGGVLLACLMAPSVLAAPVVGAVLDAATSPRLVMLLGGVLLAAGVLVASAAAALPVWVVVLALLAAGCAMPVFVGGLSAFAAEVMPGDVTRATSVDALSYNLAGIGGPGIVSGMSLLLGPSTALVALAVVMLAGCGLLQLLPIAPRDGSFHPAALWRGIAAAMHTLVTHGPVARVVAGGAIVMIGAGALPVVAVLVAVSRGQHETAGAVLLTAFSVGGVIGAVLVALPATSRLMGRFPAARVMAICFTTTGVATALAAVLPGFVGAAIALALAGLPDASGVAAMFRLRTEASPAPVRAQIFVVASGLRVAGGSLGAALGAALTGLAPDVLLLLIAVSWVSAAPILLAGRGPRRRPAVRPAG
jgi:MFS family permease